MLPCVDYLRVILPTNAPAVSDSNIRFARAYSMGANASTSLDMISPSPTSEFFGIVHWVPFSTRRKAACPDLGGFTTGSFALSPVRRHGKRRSGGPESAQPNLPQCLVFDSVRHTSESRHDVIPTARCCICATG